MVDYDPHRWLDSFFDIKGSMLRELLGRVLACVVWAGAVVAFHRHVRAVDVGASVHTMVGTALGFLLVFRTNSSYDRFWEGRKLWGGMVNESRNLARASGVFLREREPALYRELLEWIAVFPWSAAAVLRGGVDLGPRVAHLPPEEVERVRQAHHAPLAVARRLSALLAEGRARGHYDAWVQLQLDQNVQLLVDYLGGCERIHKTPMPFAYMVHLRRALVLYLLTLPFALVSGLGWWTMLAQLIVAYVFFGIEEIGVEIEDPFGLDDNDLPLERICTTIQGNVLDLAPGGAVQAPLTPALSPSGRGR